MCSDFCVVLDPKILSICLFLACPYSSHLWGQTFLRTNVSRIPSGLAHELKCNRNNFKGDGLPQIL